MKDIGSYNIEVILVDNTIRHHDDNHFDNTTPPSLTCHNSERRRTRTRFHRPIVHDHDCNDRKRDHNDRNGDCVRKSDILRRRGSRDDYSSCGDSSFSSASSFSIDDGLYDYNLDYTFLDNEMKILHGDKEQHMARLIIESIKDGLEAVTSCVGHEKLCSEDKSCDEKEEEAGTSKDDNLYDFVSTLFWSDSKLSKGKDVSTRLISDEEGISSNPMIRTPILQDNDSFESDSSSSSSEKKDMLTKQGDDIITQLPEDNEEPIPKISTNEKYDPLSLSTAVKARRVVYGRDERFKKKSKNKRSKAILSILLGEDVTPILEEKRDVHCLGDRWNKNQQMEELNTETSTNRMSDQPSLKGRRVVHCRDGRFKKKRKRNRSEALIDIFSNNKTTASKTHLPSSPMSDNQEEASLVPVPSDQPLLHREQVSMMKVRIDIRDGNEEREEAKNVISRNHLEGIIKSGNA